MEIARPPKEVVQEHAATIRRLAEQFRRSRGDDVTLKPHCGRSVWTVIINSAISRGNLTVMEAPIPGQSTPLRHTIYDLEHPPIWGDDVNKLGQLAQILTRLVPYFPDRNE